MFNELINSIPEAEMEKTVCGILNMFDDETIQQYAKHPNHYLHKYLFLLESEETQNAFVSYIEELLDMADDLKKAVDNGFDINSVDRNMTYENFKKLGFPS